MKIYILISFVIVTAIVGYFFVFRQSKLTAQKCIDSIQNYPITEQEAQCIAEKEIKATISSEYPQEMVITGVTSSDSGWTFTYTTKKAAKTGNYAEYGVPGTHPVFVDKYGKTKIILPLGSE